jgi:energy-coupling factor transporter ATP-binding protein EcfA2
MNEPIKYIAKVEIKNLWGRYDIEWNLDPSVNVLSGINGSGKSTVLGCITMAILPYPTDIESPRNKCQDVIINYNNDVEITYSRIDSSSGRKQVVGIDEDYSEFFIRMRYDVISTFDKSLNMNATPDEKVKTELDKHIFNLQKKYLDYQLNIGKKAFEIASKNSKNTNEEVLEVKKQHNRFLEIIDILFSDTDKKVDRENNELMFLSGKNKLTPYQLSSGEKQMLVILMTVLVQDNHQSILFMDEPEISLHLDWQRKLIQYIKELNPNVQIILATHSPGIILEGWSDKVSEMSDLITHDRQAKLENAK